MTEAKHKPGSAALDPNPYLNRELSLLEFQRRVLEEAQTESNPLLERVKFLSIFGSNMDEFFMVRVSGIRKQVEAGVTEPTPDGLSPREQLAGVRSAAAELYEEAQGTFRHMLLPALIKAGIHVLEYSELSDAQRQRADAFFTEVVHPVLTPLALESDQPLPHIANLSLNLAIEIRDAAGTEKFARLAVPDGLPRLVPLKKSSGAAKPDGTIPRHHYFVWLEQVIAANIQSVFPGMEVRSAHPFRVIRDADIQIQELEADDLLETMEESIRRRRYGSVVQVAVLNNMPRETSRLLRENLALRESDLFMQSWPLGLVSLQQLYASVDRHDLKFPPSKARSLPQFRKIAAPEDIFAAISQEDLLVHHPYDSFDAVLEFLLAAARDPDVLAIKQTLYRVGPNAPVVDALLEASEHGKQVAALVELKARFDEESNIGWARMLEQAGVHVVYGLAGLKTHCKVTLVVRQEGEHVRRYVHMATGNYNQATAAVYEDLGLFTCDEAFGADSTDLFNFLTGYSTEPEYRKLLVAPGSMRKRLGDLIEQQIARAGEGKTARLIFKANAITDPQMIGLLCKASQAGIQVDLLVRGICCLRPGVSGLSENIRVRSVVGRYLEHSRIYCFGAAGEEQIYLGSADLMQRNLNRRVEVLFPVEDPDHIRYLRDHVLERLLTDEVQTRIMDSEGTYRRLAPESHEEAIGVQDWLMANAWSHGTGTEADP